MAADIRSARGQNQCNPGWTNGQLLFHVLLGFALVLPLASLLVFFGHLPRTYSKVFGGINFHALLQPRQCARSTRRVRLLGRAETIRKFDRVHEAILARLDRIRPDDWQLTMHYPTRWDPHFRADMGLEDLFQYPIIHLRHHLAQLRAT